MPNLAAVLMDRSTTTRRQERRNLHGFPEQNICHCIHCVQGQVKVCSLRMQLTVMRYLIRHENLRVEIEALFFSLLPSLLRVTVEINLIIYSARINCCQLLTSSQKSSCWTSGCLCQELFIASYSIMSPRFTSLDNNFRSPFRESVTTLGSAVRLLLYKISVYFQFRRLLIMTREASNFSVNRGRSILHEMRQRKNSLSYFAMPEFCKSYSKSGHGQNLSQHSLLSFYSM
mgnify:CR=1 FL=1